MLRIDVLTLFPEIFAGVFQSSILKRAQEKQCCQLQAVDLRTFSIGKHRQVDDSPYGGGAGMVLMPEPLFKAVEALKTERTKVILTCPRGQLFDQAMASRYSRQEHLIIICGHYEGVDERVRTSLVDEVVSIGDYILTGGEIPAMAIVDAAVRLLPQVLGNEGSLEQGAYPQYTRPAEFRKMKVPDVLLSGDHAKIEEWRRKEDRK
ncbi:MAG: tRNA (guanosine(37)-N1)-methyltransferase TrmD [Candidatus Margulisiibacteriota bacterium]|jgi:tRNA (guanine37-N1)-methyltransferase